MGGYLLLRLLLDAQWMLLLSVIALTIALLLRQRLAAILGTAAVLLLSAAALVLPGRWSSLSILRHGSPLAALHMGRYFQSWQTFSFFSHLCRSVTFFPPPPHFPSLFCFGRFCTCGELRCGRGVFRFSPPRPVPPAQSLGD